MEKIYQGETIVELPFGEYLSEPDKYSIEVYPGVHLDCKNHPIGSMNHSCNPSSVIQKGKVVAFKCIEADDEITVNYLKTESRLAVPFECRCGYCEPGTKILGKSL